MDKYYLLNALQKRKDDAQYDKIDKFFKELKVSNQTEFKEILDVLCLQCNLAVREVRKACIYTREGIETQGFYDNGNNHALTIFLMPGVEYFTFELGEGARKYVELPEMYKHISRIISKRDTYNPCNR